MNEKTIHLKDLKDQCALSEIMCAYFAEAAAVCLEINNHTPNTELLVRGDYKSSVNISWETVNPRIFESWKNLHEAVEVAAYGIAILSIWKLTKYEVISQSWQGSNVDFWCVEKQGEFPFQDLKKLEVSGILRGSMGQINNRVKDKIDQVKRGPQPAVPFYVLVAEFSRPFVKLVEG